VANLSAVQVLVVLPTYNEQANIERMLEAIRAAVPACNILVVDDSSPDGTAAIAEKVGERVGQISVLVRDAKEGLGPAYRAGFAWGLEQGYDALVEMDSDFSHDPGELSGLLVAAEAGADLVIGSRYVEGGSIPAWSKSRELLSRSGNLYANLVLGLGVHDSTAGFRVYRAGLLRQIDVAKVRANGYGFQIEMTYRSRRADARIVEVPIHFVDRVAGSSKMSRSVVTEALALVTIWGARRFFGLGPSDAASRTPAVV
jgi:dolichol-phosphate mannosyltransferase